MAVDYSLLALVIIGSIVFMSAILSVKWIFFRMNLMFKTLIWRKKNVGLIFQRSLGNSWDIPLIVKISDNKKEDKESIHVFCREEFKEGTFFGFPFMFMDIEDMKSSVGLYQVLKAKISKSVVPNESVGYFKVITSDKGEKTYTPFTREQFEFYKAQCDSKGEALTHEVFVGKNEKGESEYMQTRIPVLSAVKTSVTVSPHLMKTVIAGAALNSAIKDFLDKNKYLLYLAGGACLAGVVAAFFAYNSQNTISQFCNQALNDKAAQIITSCKTAITNASGMFK